VRVTQVQLDALFLSFRQARLISHFESVK